MLKCVILLLVHVEIPLWRHYDWWSLWSTMLKVEREFTATSWWNAAFPTLAPTTHTHNHHNQTSFFFLVEFDITQPNHNFNRVTGSISSRCIECKGSLASCYPVQLTMPKLACWSKISRRLTRCLILWAFRSFESFFSANWMSLAHWCSKCMAASLGWHPKSTDCHARRFRNSLCSNCH